MSYKFYFLLPLAATLWFCMCSNEDNTHKSVVEINRKIAYTEWMSLLNTQESSFMDEKFGKSNEKEVVISNMKKQFYDLNYKLPDSLNKNSLIFKYILEHPELPGFIKKSLVEKRPIELLSIGEFFLIMDDTSQEMYISTASFKHNPDELVVGYKNNSNPEKGTVSGMIWIFKYGFLWRYGDAY